MESIRNRARENLPSVLLTLLSIVQAIALETLWSHVTERQDLFDTGWAAAFGWLQVVTVLLLIILIWLVYVSVAMRFRWTPTVGDLSLPFGVGVVELLLIEVMGPERPYAWFAVLSLAYVLVYGFTHNLFLRARQDPENLEFFSRVEASTWRDHVTRGGIITLLLLLGAGSWFWEAEPGLLLPGAALALLVTAYNVGSVRAYWLTSMGNQGSG